MARTMRLAECTNFCRRFGIALHAGVDLMSLLKSEAKHGSDRHRGVLNAVSSHIANGNTLADSMRQADAKYFPRLMLSMVHLGEQTGRLERTLAQLADHYQNQLATRRVFLMSIIWPGIQLGAAVMVIGLLIWLLGILTPAGGGEMFDPLGWGLRGNSGLLIYFSGVFAIAGAVFFMYQAVRRNWFNLQALVPLFYLIPKLGPALQTITLARFTWTLSMALDAGLDPMRGVELALDSTDSEYYRSETKKAQKSIQAGQSLAESLEKTEIFPQEFISALEVAEISGTDAESLGLLAVDYDQRAKTAMRTIAGLATVAIWVLVAGLLIFVILSMAMKIAGVYSEALEGL